MARFSDGWRRQVKICAILAALVIGAASYRAVPASAASPAALFDRTVNGKSVSGVTFHLKDRGIRPALLMAGGGMPSRASLASMGDAGGVFAAVGGVACVSVGGFSMPRGVLIEDGKLIHTGEGLTAAITGDGRFLLDDVSFDLYGYVNGALKVIPWGVNHLTEEGEGITLFTPEFGAVVPVAAGSRAVVVADGVVSHITSSDFVVPDNGFAFLFNPDVVYMVGERFKIGDHASYDYRANTVMTRPQDWGDVSVAIGALADLVVGGKATAGMHAPEEARKLAARADRAFMGASAGGALTVGLLRDVSLKDAAETCKAMGLVDAVCMDAGSSAFYFDGQSVKAGADINNSIGFAEISSAGGKGATASLALAKELNVSVKGSVTNLRGYNVGGSNYFMLRDVAYLLKDTEYRFGVGWNGGSKTISIYKGRNYVPDGSELKPAASFADRSAPPGGASLAVSGAVYSLSVYNLDGNNYFRLRDLGGVLGFPVGWDMGAGVILID
ncbi:MAG: hypothetical protein LBG71_05850 [Clostridiales Family XIII bacterium]|jgi:hypothetical protein|nr:hypothetical protein [Clostridiales Family XIII bacterium]